MYQASYGATDFPAGADIGLSFAHTNDNIGPQSAGQTVEALRHIRHAWPDAEITASTLDAFGAEMWAGREQFPVLEQEIGDSWIHGTASDPEKLARFRALQRLCDGFDTITPERLAFGRGLTQVAEHTWGVDIKTYLRDETAWTRPDFEAARRSDYRFAYTEQSWAEQCLDTPQGTGPWSLFKLGLWNDGRNIVRGGGGQLQAVAAVRAPVGTGMLTATPLDSALVAPASAPFMPFQPKCPILPGASVSTSTTTSGAPISHVVGGHGCLQNGPGAASVMNRWSARARRK
ncbi:hypothetical protein ASD04_17010 [Devosia sp. Root436]|nr:hypothetical protein ASD04_17010 [Devosia sp. Root436]